MRTLPWTVATLCLPPITALAALVALAPEAQASRLVYVNTDPITVQAGMTNDPTMDSVSVNGYTMTEFDGWTGASEEQRRELLALLKDTSVAFDIEFVLDRPAAGPYDMVVFGSADDHTSSFGGTCSAQVGLSDCGDASGAAIAFTYWGCLDMDEQLDPKRVAFHTLGALGYGWGLENIAGNGQIMSGWSASALEFGTACANINGPSGCAHAGCDAGKQDSSADLTATLGARVDDGPAEITVLEPQPNADVTAPFDVVVDIHDAFGGVTAQLEIVGFDVPPVVDDTFPYRWNDLALGDGPLTLKITAIDADGNESSTEISVCVGGDCPDPDPTGDTGEDGDSGEEDVGEDAGEDGVGATGDDGQPADEGGESSGCAVVAAPEDRPFKAGGIGALAALALFGIGRRRRAAGSSPVRHS